MDILPIQKSVNFLAFFGYLLYNKRDSRSMFSRASHPDVGEIVVSPALRFAVAMMREHSHRNGRLYGSRPALHYFCNRWINLVHGSRRLLFCQHRPKCSAIHSVLPALLGFLGEKTISPIITNRFHQRLLDEFCFNEFHFWEKEGHSVW